MPVDGKMFDDILVSAGVKLPEFDEVAEMYEAYMVEQGEEVEPTRQTAELVSRMAILYAEHKIRARAIPTRIDHFRLREFDDDSMENRLFTRRYNNLLDRCWREHTTLHPERSAWTDEEMTAVARQALRLTRATLPRMQRKIA